MGYTTSFEGGMALSRPLTVPELRELEALAEYEEDEYKKYSDTKPDNGYNQWTPNKDGTAMVWNDGEKFYDYAEWLQWLIDYYFKPRNIELRGRINYQGEEIGDVGYLEVLEDQHVRTYTLEAKGIVECPHCGERFNPDEDN